LIWDDSALGHKQIVALKRLKPGGAVIVMAGNPHAPEYYLTRVEKATPLQVVVRGVLFWRFTGKPVVEGVPDQRIFPPETRYLRRVVEYAVLQSKESR
jgi:mannose-6-phosphate isomerase class I